MKDEVFTAKEIRLFENVAQLFLKSSCSRYLSNTGPFELRALQVNYHIGLVGHLGHLLTNVFLKFNEIGTPNNVSILFAFLNI
jgi:hypothetical protein